MNADDDGYRDYDDPEFDSPFDYDEFDAEDADRRRRPRRRLRDDDDDWHRRRAKGGSLLKRVLIGLAVIFVGMPLLCCGGLLVVSSLYKPFKLANGEHLGGGAMNLRFDYEYKGRETFLKDGYFIVARTADDITREQGIPTRFSTRGTWHFSANVGPAEPDKSPVTVWLEKESFHGGRSKASNEIRIYFKEQ